MAERQTFDLVIRGGTVVTASSHVVTDLGVRDGAVVQIGGAMRADREIDAAGKLVLPGGIDMHVHLTPVERDSGGIQWADDFTSGTRAAAAGGITTIGNITFPDAEETIFAAVERVTREAEQTALVDFALHPVVFDPSPAGRAHLRRLAESGNTSVKIFMTLANFDGRAREYLDFMHEAAGLGMLSMIHCEDGCIIGHLTERLMAAGKTGYEHYPASRPAYSEEVAVTRAIGFSEAADAPIYVVHLSSGAALEACHRARARGVRVYVETRPLYIHLTRERFLEPDAAKYVGQPPLREAADATALWNGLWDGDIQTFCTDHAAWKLDEKLDPTLTIENLRPGVADLETLLPMLFSEGVGKGRISLHRFVDVTSTNAARLFGLFPKKGTIAVGSDADLTIWDPNLTKTVSGAKMESLAGYSPYDGWDVTGWPITTISRGEIVFANGEITGQAGRGRRVHRGPTQML